MSNQNSSEDDGSRDSASRIDNVGSREHSEELTLIHDAFEDIAHIFDGLMRDDHELRAFVEQQGGNVDSLPEEGEQQGGNVDIRPEEADEHQDRNVGSLPAEDHTATAGRPEPGSWQLEAEALRNRVQAVIVYFLQRMNNAEVSEMIEEGIFKGGIVPRPTHSIGDEGAHLDRMGKNRPFGIKHKKKKKRPEPSEEAQEVCHSIVCCDPRWYSVSHFVFFSLRISWLKQPSAGRATTAKEGAEEVPPWPLDSEPERQRRTEQTVG
jgi:hypothetical protein